MPYTHLITVSESTERRQNSFAVKQKNPRDVPHQSRKEQTDSKIRTPIDDTAIFASRSPKSMHTSRSLLKRRSGATFAEKRAHLPLLCTRYVRTSSGICERHHHSASSSCPSSMLGPSCFVISSFTPLMNPLFFSSASLQMQLQRINADSLEDFFLAAGKVRSKRS